MRSEVRVHRSDSKRKRGGPKPGRRASLSKPLTITD
jgi:hypothetical protein